jgi:hypothetical protein
VVGGQNGQFRLTPTVPQIRNFGGTRLIETFNNLKNSEIQNESESKKGYR